MAVDLLSFFSDLLLLFFCFRIELSARIFSISASVDRNEGDLYSVRKAEC